MPGPSTRRTFTQDQIDAIEAAIAETERRTSCELVVAVIPRADAYDRAADLVGLASSIIALALGSIVVAALLPATKVSGSWSAPAALPIGLVPAIALVLGGFGGGVLLARAFPRAALIFVRRRIRELACRTDGASIFHRLHVRRTAEGTGILILISLLERIVVVIPDERASEHLDPEVIRATAAMIAAAFKNKEGPQSLTTAIAALGGELEAKLPADQSRNPDELTNQLRLL